MPARPYYLKNRERIIAEVKRWSQENPEKSNANKAKWLKNNPEKRRQATKKYREANRDYPAKWIRNRRANDVNFKILCNLRRRLYDAQLRKSWSRSAVKLLGCSIIDFRIYLESKFEVGMSWENYGRHGWHIDHIVPCALFDLTKEEHRKRCFHFSNLQPMFAKENQKKSAKSDGQLRIL